MLIPGELHVASECPINHERALKARITPRPRVAEWRVGGVWAPALAHITGSSVMCDALLLNLDMSERLCAEIDYVSLRGSEDGGLRMRET